MRTAVEALHQIGFQSSTLDALALFRHHAPQLRFLGGTPIELHHSLGLGPAGRLLTSDEVLRDSSIKEGNGVRIRIPSPEHLITHLILHSQVHHKYRERIWPPLRAMWDLVLLNRRWSPGLSWRNIEQQFRSRGQHATLLLHLLQVEQTLGLDRPFPFSLGKLGTLRWIRRKILNRAPAVRFLDPIYLLMSMLSRRFHLLLSIFSIPGGWKHAAKMLFHPGFYRRLLAEVAAR